MRRYSADKLAPAGYALPSANCIRIILCYNKTQMHAPCRRQSRWSRLRTLPHDKPQAGVDGVEFKEVPVASLPGAGIEILTQTIEPRF